MLNVSGNYLHLKSLTSGIIWPQKYKKTSSRYRAGTSDWQQRVRVIWKDMSWRSFQITLAVVVIWLLFLDILSENFDLANKRNSKPYSHGRHSYSLEGLNCGYSNQKLWSWLSAFLREQNPSLLPDINVPSGMMVTVKCTSTDNKSFLLHGTPSISTL